MNALSMWPGNKTKILQGLFAPLAEQMAVGKATACTKTSNSESHSGRLNPYDYASLNYSYGGLQSMA